MSSSNLNTVVRNGYTGGDTGKGWKASVTATQLRVIRNVTAATTLGQEDVGAYVASGDISCLEATTHQALRAYVKACQEQAPSESAARRYWPRKIASVILHGE